MKKNDFIYLKHILDAIEKIYNYLSDIFDYEMFDKDSKTQDAVLRQLSIIGEAANKISSEFKLKYPELPYQNMIAMRNFVIHEYFGVDTKVVWDTCYEDLPPVKEIIEKILQEEHKI